MKIAQAQKDVRTTFLGGFAGQLVSSAIWFLSAIGMQWFSFKAGFLILIVGGFFIFPLTQLLLRRMGHAYALPKGHPMNALGMQVAFTLPLTLPVVFALTACRENLLYPAIMITLGAHYLPFIFMYGMWQFGALAALLIGSGVLIGHFLSASLTVGGWTTAVLLLISAFVGRQAAMAEGFTPGL
jgi:hypothetical protein